MKILQEYFFVCNQILIIKNEENNRLRNFILTKKGKITVFEHIFYSFLKKNGL